MRRNPAEQAAKGGRQRAAAAGQRHAREEGRARGADMALAPRSTCSAAAMSGRRASRSEGSPAGMSASRSRLSSAGRPAGPPAAARPPAAPARSRPGRAAAAATRGWRAPARPRPRPGAGPARSRCRCRTAACDAVGLLCRRQGVARDGERIVVGQHGQVLVGHRRHQRDLRRLAVLGLGEILRQRTVLEAADAAEEVDLQETLRPTEYSVLIGLPLRVRSWACASGSSSRPR